MIKCLSLSLNIFESIGVDAFSGLGLFCFYIFVFILSVDKFTAE